MITKDQQEALKNARLCVAESESEDDCSQYSQYCAKCTAAKGCDGVSGPLNIIKGLLSIIDDAEMPLTARTAPSESFCDESRVKTHPNVETPQNAPCAPTRASILRNAEAHVSGDPEHDYGGPEESFTIIAKLWNAYLDAVNGVFDPHRRLKPHDVAAMMVLLKVARIPLNPQKTDTWEDIAGYAACGGELAGRMNER